MTRITTSYGLENAGIGRVIIQIEIHSLPKISIDFSAITSEKTFNKRFPSLGHQSHKIMCRVSNSEISPIENSCNMAMFWCAKNMVSSQVPMGQDRLKGGVCLVREKMLPARCRLLTL